MFDYTPLHYASKKGHLGVVEYLVNHKADINAKDRGGGYENLLGLPFILLPVMVISVLLNI